MERLTYDFCIGGNHCWQVKGADNLECREVCQQQEENGCKDCPIAKAFDRLADIEDILGDEYDLDHLRKLVQIDRLIGKDVWSADPFQDNKPRDGGGVYAEKNQRKAARMMGYEIIEDDQPESNQEAKADSGKPRPSLVPPALIDGVMRIREFGTARYGDPDNWRNVDAERYHDALLRHILAMWEDWKAVDPDSGMPHLWHAACNIAFLMQYMEDEKR